MNNETPDCADDKSPLSQALSHLRREAMHHIHTIPEGECGLCGTFIMTLLDGTTTEPIAFDATEAEVQAAVDAAIEKHEREKLLYNEIVFWFDLHCACGSKEAITVSHITDLYRVLNEKGYVLIPTQHGRIVQVVCPDCCV